MDRDCIAFDNTVVQKGGFTKCIVRNGAKILIVSMKIPCFILMKSAKKVCTICCVIVLLKEVKLREVHD